MKSPHRLPPVNLHATLGHPSMNLPRRSSSTLWKWLARGTCLASSLGLLTADDLSDSFQRPPDSARPWVYWYFMDGNLTREGMTADLEAMKRAGIGGGIFLEVDLGLPRGPVKFMSEPWREMFRHAVTEADRLGLCIAAGAGPGWCGTGGPWVKPEQSMQHLVGSETAVQGPMRFDRVLPRPSPRTPFFGEGTLTPELAREWREFYRDVAVIAFPAPDAPATITDADEKALYFRAPFSSQPGVKPFLPAPATLPATRANSCLPSKRVMDLTDKVAADGRLVWDVPAGKWVIYRFVRTTTGQTTRPAPLPGLGFESDKFEQASLDSHFKAFTGKLLADLGTSARHKDRGLTTVHFDSWEMSSQNWSEHFRQEFRKRRGYDPLPFLPAMLGRVVDSLEVSERFLWDLRQTAQELVVQNHAAHLRDLSHEAGLNFSIEPYDLNPAADLTLGSVGDVPMCEFWYQGFDTSYSVLEAASIAHTGGRKIVAAESFTAEPGEDWRAYPGSMKNLGDWAFCAGVNRIVFHRYQHQPWLDRFPGMTMSRYGVHWERTQTWWDLVPAYHTYLSRCQQMLRQGVPVADILYLAAEGAPHVFRPPTSALRGSPPDRREFNFDGCSPDVLRASAAVKNGRVIFPGGASYAILVLPQFDTMTPELLQKIKQLIQDGATVLGAPPARSPSFSGYPACDTKVKELAAEIWGEKTGSTPSAAPRKVGRGRVILDTECLAQTELPNPLATAKWIWYPEENPAVSALPRACKFERQFALPPSEPAASANLFITADNSFEVFLNGRSVGRGDSFHRVYRFPVLKQLKPGTNFLSVVAQNSGTEPNPAGCIAGLRVAFKTHEVFQLSTDESWTAAPDAQDVRQPAKVLGPVGMSPWNLNPSVSEPRDIYPSYDTVAQILQNSGVEPDFACEGAIRYTHRLEGQTHIYFLANTRAEFLKTQARFRVGHGQPQLWDPVTGSMRDLPEFSQRGGITTIPLEFEGFQSFFLVFDQARKSHPQQPRRNFPQVIKTAEMAGPWKVAFDPHWGGPEEAVFAQLEDWSKRAEPGIRYYSGKATYRMEFPKPSTNGKRQWLDLGNVQVMAAVKLNGKDLGVVWCAPWWVEIPAAILEATNRLEVTVANLWPNRLIRDAGLPPDQRLTWTSINPFQKDTPLLSSGLLGPVTWQREQ